MANLCDHIQTADWKAEKHVPVIDCPDKVGAGEKFKVSVCIGKEIDHPNTTEHHIRWITLYYHAEGEKFNHEIGHFEFNAHGESADGANEGPVYTAHEVTSTLQISKSGTIHALSYCNIHGMWESSKDVSLA
jgi:superoxide reductase